MSAGARSILPPFASAKGTSRRRRRAPQTPGERPRSPFHLARRVERKMDPWALEKKSTLVRVPTNMPDPECAVIYDGTQETTGLTPARLLAHVAQPSITAPKGHQRLLIDYSREGETFIITMLSEGQNEYRRLREATATAESEDATRAVRSDVGEC